MGLLAQPLASLAHHVGQIGSICELRLRLNCLSRVRQGISGATSVT